MALTINPGVTLKPGVSVKVPVYVPPPQSLSWDGTEMYIQVSGNRGDWNLGDTYTVEWWEKMPDAGIGDFRGVIGQMVTSVPAGFDFWHNNSRINVNNAQIYFGQPTAGVWHHIVVQKDGTTFTAYIDGVSQAVSGNTAGASTFANGSQDFLIGERTFDGTNPLGQRFKGFVANIKISKVARYSATFTPTTVLTTDANTVLAVSGELVDLTGRHTITNNGVAVSIDFPN